MVLIILASLLIAGIVVYQASQGAFSAMIMAMLSLFCAVVALNYFEPLGLLLVGRLGAYAQGASLLALFVLPLLGLRTLSDRYIAGNVVLTAWPDRLGGAGFGLATGMILVGMLMIVLCLLPLPASIFGYRPYDTTLRPHHGGPPQWAAKFTLGLANHISAGAMSPIGGGREFGQAHDDLTLEAFCLRNRPPGARASALLDSMEVTDAYRVLPPPKGQSADADLAAVLKAPRYATIAGQTDILVVRVRVDELARNQNDNWYRLPATHFRLLTESGRSFYPVDYLTHAGIWRLNAQRDDKGNSKICDILIARPWDSNGGPKKLVVDWVYRLPAKERPQAVIFRRVCWSEIHDIIEGLPQPFDQNRDKLALSMKPATTRVTFPDAPAAPTGLLEPTGMAASELLPPTIKQILLHNDPSMQPDSIKGISLASQNSLGSADFAASTDDLHKAPKAISKSVSRFGATSSKYMIVQFQFRVNKAFRVSAAARRNLMKMTPQLLLDDGRRLHHYGAYLTYQVQQKWWLRLYHDRQRWAESGLVKGDFVTKLLDNVNNAEMVGFVFMAPVDKDRSVVGISLGIGPEYDFYAPSPLSTFRGQ